MPSGFEAQALDQAGERALTALVSSWLGPHFPGPTKPHPDLRKVDLTVEVPGYSSDVGRITLDFQIKTTSATPSTKVVPWLGNAECYALRLGKTYIQGLFERAHADGDLFLLLGVLNEGVELESLPDYGPKEQFRWYVVDVGLYRQKLDPDAMSGTFYVPVRNRLNLALFALLWAARWVKTYFHPLRDIPGSGILPPTVELLIASFDQRAATLGDMTRQLLEAASQDFDALRDALDAGQYQRLLGPMALTGSLRAVTAAFEKTTRTTSADAYCPEALAGSLCLWLFSRAYHDWMRTTQRKAEVNRRLLPVLDADLRTLAPFFRAALFHIRRLYVLRGAEVALVKPFADGPRNDYSSYGDALTPFHWVVVDEHGNISLEQTRLSGSAEDEEALAVAREGTITALGLDDSTAWGFRSTSWDDVRLEPGAVPVGLFPADDAFLEVPCELWESGGFYN